MLKIINLDATFDPYDNQDIERVAIEMFKFPGGESHVRVGKIEKDAEYYITHRLNTAESIMQLVLTINALRMGGVPSDKITAFVPYFPYARQDRVCNPGEPNSFKLMQEMLYGAGRIVTFDLHNPLVAGDVENFSSNSFVDRVYSATNKPILVCPDKGARERVREAAFYIGTDAIVNCDKVRDPLTGRLSSFKVDSEDLGGQDCMIVDDICDGGGTFLGIAKSLKEKGAGKLYLCVSHGIFSQGTEELLKYFEKIFTTDSIRNEQLPGVEIKKMKTHICL